MIHKNAVGKSDPHRLSPVRGPSSELEAHVESSINKKRTLFCC